MKRTRRIEIVRYTRRVTVTGGGTTTADAGEPPAIDITPAPPEGEDGRRDAAVAAEPQKPQRRSAVGLRHLLSRRR